MTWIKSGPPAQADSALAAAYEKAASFSKHGRVSNLWQAWGGDPGGVETLDAHYPALPRRPPRPSGRPRAPQAGTGGDGGGVGLGDERLRLLRRAPRPAAGGTRGRAARP